MTYDELEQLQALRGLVNRERERVKRLRAAAGIKSPSLSGMPHQSGVHDRISENIPEAVDLESGIQEKLAELEARMMQIQDWIDQQPPKVRLILNLRYVDGLTWNQVADEVYRDSMNPGSEDAVRMYLKRYMRKEEKKSGSSINGESAGRG